MSFTDTLRRRAKKQITPSLIGTMSPFQILGRPVITEKAFAQTEKENVYVFLVLADATKVDVKVSLEHIYKVTPASIRVVNVGKKMRLRRGVVRKAYKKVYVKLKTGDKIDLTS